MRMKSEYRGNELAAAVRSRVSLARLHFVALQPRHGKITLKRLIRLTVPWIIAEGALLQPALALCTRSGSVGPSSTAIAGSNDIAGVEGRHYLLIQNTGTVNPMNVAIGSNNAATSGDLYLLPGASWVMTMQGTKMLPGGDVAAISSLGTTYSFCDW